MDLPSAGKGSGPSIKASLQKTKIGEAVVKLRAPVWCRPKTLRCLSQLRRVTFADRRGMTTLRTQLRIVSETMHSAHSLPKTDQPPLGPLPNGTRRPESFLLAAISEPSFTFTLKPLVPVAKELEGPSSLLPSPLFFFCALQMSQLSLAERQEIVKLIYIPPFLKRPSPSPSIPALASLPKTPNGPTPITKSIGGPTSDWPRPLNSKPSLKLSWLPCRTARSMKVLGKAHVIARIPTEASAQSFGTQAFAAQNHHLVIKRQDLSQQSLQLRQPKFTFLFKVPSYQQSLRLTQLLFYLPSVNATSSLTTWGTRDCPTAPTEPGMLGHDHTKAYKFPTQKSLLDRELGGLLFTP
ncbi:unnamed protein product [Prunus armeniaca]